MLLLGIIIKNVTLVENTVCQYGSKKLKRNCMEVYILTWQLGSIHTVLGSSRGKFHLSLLHGLLKSTEKKI